MTLTSRRLVSPGRLKLSPGLTTPKPLGAAPPPTAILLNASFNPPNPPSALDVRCGTTPLEFCRLVDVDRTPFAGVGGETKGFVLPHQPYRVERWVQGGIPNLHVGRRGVRLVLACERHILGLSLG